MKVGVIVGTYNTPEWLAKVFFGYEQQTDLDFHLIVADDGSGVETAQVIERFRQRGRLSLQHVWQQDSGFRKCGILNRAIASCDCDYLIFTDGDCIPRRDFVAVHKRRAKPKYFLAGSCQRLTLPISQAITEQDIASGRAFDGCWLLSQGLPLSTKHLRLFMGRWVAEVLNRITTTKGSFSGGNSSAWRADIERINGFDERMGHGGEDAELGYRLIHSGTRPIQIRHSAIVVHLEHERNYIDPESRARNLQIRTKTVRSRVAWTSFGIQKNPCSIDSVRPFDVKYPTDGHS